MSHGDGGKGSDRRPGEGFSEGYGRIWPEKCRRCALAKGECECPVKCCENETKGESDERV